MCFHSKQSKDAQTIEKRFNSIIKDKQNFITSNHYNGFEFPKTPIITNNDKNIIQLATWGLIPKWSNENWDKSLTLNARIETLNQKKSFENILQNRCIIIVDGFYEWYYNEITKKKEKYEIGFNGELFVFAGLYTIHSNNIYYTIITTQAKGIMEKIHNTKLRMPFSISDDKKMNYWLNNKNIEADYNFSTKPEFIENTDIFKFI